MLLALLVGTSPHCQEASEESTLHTDIALGPTCVTSECHGDLAPAPGVHGPLNVGNCQVCHEPVEGRHEFRMARSGPSLCGLCHQLALEGVIHEPVTSGDCMGCHDPHRSEFPPLLNESPEAGLCMRCHEDDAVMNHPVVHGPVRAGACILCHESHSSANPHLVRPPAGELCSFCHAQEIQEFSGMRHQHPPLVEGGCLACHDPHGGQTASLTHEPPPGLCYTCHRELEQEIAAAPVVHGPVTSGEACSSCHGSHGSSMPALLRGGELDLCLSCHDREITMPTGQVVPDVATLIRSSQYLHGPVRDGNCTSCHDPHDSPNFALLKHPYPPEFYAAWDPARYALCFECHREDAFVTAQTDSLTNFRDGENNLHFVHTAGSQRGRTCRACHEVHASNRPFHMSDSVPYGGWRLPINFETLDGGGRCSPGCHDPEEYHRPAADVRPGAGETEVPAPTPAGE